MKKNIDFYMGKAEAINISKELNKFGLEVNIISRNSYKFEELQEIFSYLNKKGLQVEVEFEDKKRNPIKKDYQNNFCGDCEYFEPGEGCFNTVSQVRTKHLKTEKSKGCYWGKWN